MNYYIYLRAGGGGTPELLYASGWPDGAQSMAEAALTFELDQPAELTFKMTPDHPSYDAVRLRLDTVDVYEDRQLIFRGSAVTIRTDRERMRTVVCKDCLSWLDDVPDRYSYEDPPAYMLGTQDAPLTLAFTGGKERIRHLWTDKDEFGIYTEDGVVKTRKNYLKVREWDSVFDVEFDGKTYRVPLEDLYEKQDGAFVQVGYMGAAGILNSDYRNEEDSPGSSAPFYITNAGIWAKPETKPETTGDESGTEEEGDAVLNETHTVRIIRRDPMPVDAMFCRMIDCTKDKKGDIKWGGYNAVCSLDRRLRRPDQPNATSVEGMLLYSPSPGDSCLDTLRAWQKQFGGYLSVKYICENGEWQPFVRYEKESGETRNDVIFSYGLNLTEVVLDETDEGLVTAIRGTAETNGTAYTLADDKSPVAPNTGYTLERDGVYKGYLQRDALLNRYGYILLDKTYTLEDDEFQTVPATYAAGRNPLEMEWYELVTFHDVYGGTVYLRTEDTSANADKTYYAKTKYDVVTNPAGGTNPAEKGWYEWQPPDPDSEWGRYIYKKTEDAAVVAGKTYYEDAAWRRLYAKVKADLDAADSETETATVTAVDARLLGIDSAPPKAGGNYPVYAAPYGLTGARYILTKNRIDLVEQSKGRLTLGREKDLLSRQVAIIRQGGR